MKKYIAILLLAFSGSAFSEDISSKTPITDRDTLCSLDYGVVDQGHFVASTPMRDACVTENYESRKRICEYNYKKLEIVAACMATYNAQTLQTNEPIALSIGRYYKMPDAASEAVYLKYLGNGEFEQSKFSITEVPE